MTLSREEVLPCLIDELERFEQLLRGLDGAQWERASRCAAWSVADIAAHVTGSMADVVNGRFDGLGTPEVTEREVSERRDKSPAEMADELVEVRNGARAIADGIDETVWNSPGPTDAI